MVNSLLSFLALCLHAVLFPTKEPFFSTFCWDQLAKIRQYHLKERPKITRVAKFKNDLLKANNSSSKSQNFTEGQVRVPHHTSICKISRLCGVIAPLLTNFKALFPAVSMDILSLVLPSNRRRVTLGTRGFFSRSTGSFVLSAAGRHVFG